MSIYSCFIPYHDGMGQHRFRSTLRAVTLGLFAIIGCLGCSKPAAKVAQQKAIPNTIESDIENIRDGLKKPHPDAEHLRHLLNQVNAVLVAEPQRRPAPLKPDEMAFLKDRLKISDSQLAEINSPEFGLLDAHVLDQALLFRDVAQTLELGDATVETKANVALDWVTRHVRLEDRPGLPDPPDRVVLRGRGSGLERIYVFVALLQQLGILGFPIGDANAADDPSRLWGVGIVHGDQVTLYDPRLGLPLPGTLSDLQKDAKPLDGLIALGYDVHAERLKSARMFPGNPTITFAPRWAVVQALMTDGGLHVGVDVKQIMAIAEKAPLSPWISNTQGTPARVLAEFLPTEEGGLDRATLGPQRRLARYQFETIPWAKLPREVAELQGPLGNFLRVSFVEIAWQDQQAGIAEIVRQRKRFLENRRALELQSKVGELPANQLLDDVVRDIQAARRTGDEQGPTLMELMLRGQNSEAIETMVGLTDQLTKIRNQKTTPNEASAWVQKAQSTFASMLRAQRTGDKAAIQELQKQFETLAQDGVMVRDWVQQQAAGPMLARLAFLQALCKHNQAEVQARHNTESARSSWKSVIHAWETMLSNFPDSPDAPHAQRLYAVALERSGQRTAAVEAFRRAGTSAKSPYDRIACLWLAKD